MPEDVFPPQTPARHHKRPHEDEKPRKFTNNRNNNDNRLQWLDHPAGSVTDFRGIHLLVGQQGEGKHDDNDADSSSIASSHKRARLYGKYRGGYSSSVMDSSDEDGETTLCSNVAVRSASDDASTGKWLLRSSPSNFSITSTLTEISDTMETMSNSGHAVDLSENAGPPCIVLQGTPDTDVGEKVESITNRMENWSLTRMKTMRISNIVSCVNNFPEKSLNDEAMSESRTRRIQQTNRAKREVMRAFRRSNSTITD